MSVYIKSLLLFTLNLIDAQLTVIWVRGGWAEEANALMAYLLEAGNAPFILTKAIIGALVAYTLYRWSHLSIARRGLKVVLGLYVGLMFIHAATGISALGYDMPEKMIAYVSYLPDNLYALLF